MNIYLVRHTDVYNPDNLFYFRLPMVLSEKGRKQAQIVGGWFVSHNLKNLPIISSPMVRCVQTAELIASKTNSFVSVDERLIEDYCPNLQGKPCGEKSWITEQEDPSREPKEEIIARMMSIVMERVKKGKDCILLSHGEPSIYLYWHLTKQKFLKYPWDPKNSHLVIRKGQVVKLEFSEKNFKKATKLSPVKQ
jgi:broad specificity phosphatase PhoE